MALGGAASEVFSICYQFEELSVPLPAARISFLKNTVV
jgi:hypothetical protein